MLGAFERWREVLRRYVGRGVHPHEMAFSLTLPLRRLILSPEELAHRLHLAPTSRVLELGPGPGYFSAEVARRVPQGELVLADLQWGMLRRARRRLAKGPKNVRLSQADGGQLPFTADSFDVVFMVAVLGEIPDPSLCLREIARVLKPGGLLSNTEQPGDPDRLAPPAVRSLAEDVGLRFMQQYGRGRNYTANFRNPRAGRSLTDQMSGGGAVDRRQVPAPPGFRVDARRGAVWLRVHRARTRSAQ